MVPGNIRNLPDDFPARQTNEPCDTPLWSIEIRDGPVVATAIHSGHEVRPDVAEWLAVPEAERLREEDPLTEMWTTAGDSSIRVHRSRFEVDLNRPREKAIVDNADDAWGLTIWRAPPPRHVVERSLEEYDRFYRDVGKVLDLLLDRWNSILVLDLHSYNYRRAGPDKPAAGLMNNPEVNVGTGTMDRKRWATLVVGFIAALQRQPFRRRQLDVRENVKFQGGFFPRWLHSTYPENVCVLSLEFKKLFMDEWSATASITAMEELRAAIRNAANAVRGELATARFNETIALTSGLTPAAEYVDSEMLDISRTFDWLQAVSPYATRDLWKDFQSSDFKGEPRFRYPDPGIDSLRLVIGCSGCRSGKSKIPCSRRCWPRSSGNSTDNSSSLNFAQPTGFFKAALTSSASPRLTFMPRLCTSSMSSRLIDVRLVAASAPTT